MIFFYFRQFLQKAKCHYLQKKQASAYRDGEINGTNNITDTNISKYIKPEMAVHMKPVILLSYPVWEDIN